MHITYSELNDLIIQRRDDYNKAVDIPLCHTRVREATINTKRNLFIGVLM